MCFSSVRTLKLATPEISPAPIQSLGVGKDKNESCSAPIAPDNPRVRASPGYIACNAASRFASDRSVRNRKSVSARSAQVRGGDSPPLRSQTSVMAITDSESPIGDNGIDLWCEDRGVPEDGPSKPSSKFQLLFDKHI